MKRIPLNALTKAVYERLSTYQDIPVYDDVPETAKPPYITLGLFTCKSNGTKVNDITDVTINIDIWSDYQGKKEVNTILDDVTTCLRYARLDLEAYGFEHIDGDVDFVEAFAEDGFGYHGVITYLAKINNKE